MKLTEEDLKEISDAVPIDEVGGNREFEVFSKYMYKFADTPLKKISNWIPDKQKPSIIFDELLQYYNYNDVTVDVIVRNCGSFSLLCVLSLVFLK